MKVTRWCLSNKLLAAWKVLLPFCFSSTSAGIFGLDMLIAAMNFINHSHHTLKGRALNLSHNWFLKRQICDSNWSSYSMTIIWFPYLLGRLIYEQFSYCLRYLFVRTWVYQTLCSSYHYTRTVSLIYTRVIKWVIWKGQRVHTVLSLKFPQHN